MWRPWFSTTCTISRIFEFCIQLRNFQFFREIVENILLCTECQKKNCKFVIHPRYFKELYRFEMIPKIQFSFCLCLHPECLYKKLLKHWQEQLFIGFYCCSKYYSTCKMSNNNFRQSKTTLKFCKNMQILQ